MPEVASSRTRSTAENLRALVTLVTPVTQLIPTPALILATLQTTEDKTKNKNKNAEVPNPKIAPSPAVARTQETPLSPPRPPKSSPL